MRLYKLKGDEPLGFRGKDGIVTATVHGKWYDSIVLDVRYDPVYGDILDEAVDLDKPLSKRQIATIRKSY